MVAKVVLHKDQLFKESFGGAIQEKKVLGFPQERSPLKPYSNIFYWSILSSDYGCSIPEHPHLGFEILTYVLKGSYETFQEEKHEWVRLQEGDLCIVQAGKGVRHAEKILPRSEILQIWLDPHFDEFKKKTPGIKNLNINSLPVNKRDGRLTWKLAGKDSAIGLNTEGVFIEVHELEAGYHMLTCPENTVMSGCILDGYIEVDEKTLGKNDFFKVEARKQIKVASLVNSKVFVMVSPLELEYQPFGSLRNN